MDLIKAGVVREPLRPLVGDLSGRTALDHD
jgi:hypothetical protein